MDKPSKDVVRHWHNRGQEDVADGTDSCLSGPWRGAFENEDHYRARNDAYEKGRANSHKQK